MYLFLRVTSGGEYVVMKQKENEKQTRKKKKNKGGLCGWVGVNKAAVVIVTMMKNWNWWKWIPAASCKSLVADNVKEKGITLLMCNPLQRLSLHLFFRLSPSHCCCLSCLSLRLTTQEGGQKVAITLPVNSSVLSNTVPPGWACWCRYQGSAGSGLSAAPLPFLMLPQPDYGLLASRLKSPSRCHSTAPPLHRHSQTQCAHLAPNQTIPKIDKQLWVRMDVQMGWEGKRGETDWEAGIVRDEKEEWDHVAEVRAGILTNPHLSTHPYWHANTAEHVCAYIHLSDLLTEGFGGSRGCASVCHVRTGLKFDLSLELVKLLGVPVCAHYRIDAHTSCAAGASHAHVA